MGALLYSVSVRTQAETAASWEARFTENDRIADIQLSDGQAIVSNIEGRTYTATTTPRKVLSVYGESVQRMSATG